MLDGRVMSLVKRLGSAIVTGNYRPGVRIDCADVVAEARAENADGPALAFSMLQSKGLISGGMGGRVVVNQQKDWDFLNPDVLGWLLAERDWPEVVLELTEMRLAFEPEASALAAGVASVVDRRRIHRAVEMLPMAITHDNGGIDKLIELHAAILGACRNRFLKRLSGVTATALKFHQRGARNGGAFDPAALARMRAVADAVLDGDPETARTQHRNLLLDELLICDARDEVLEDTLSQAPRAGRKSA